MKFKIKQFSSRKKKTLVENMTKDIVIKFTMEKDPFINTLIHSFILSFSEYIAV